MPPIRDRSSSATCALVVLMGVTVAPVTAQDLPQSEGAQPPAEGVDYVVYDRLGSRTSLAEVLSQAGDSEVLLVGEEHDDMVGHALETELLRGAIEGFGEVRTVVLSLEMFERDVQYVLDEYVDGVISEDHFLRSARPWDDYETRYRPLVETAKEHGSPIVAANAPRRYVNLVTREGPGALSGLSDLAKSFLPPLPYPGPSATYRAQWDALMAEAMAASRPDSAQEEEAESELPEEVEREAHVADQEEAEAEAEAPDHSISSNAILSQALWDAAMGHAITAALVDHLGALVLHFAGSFHVQSGTGIPERIEDYRPGTRVTTIVMAKADDVQAWSAEVHAGLADFVVLTKRPSEPTEPVGGVGG